VQIDAGNYPPPQMNQMIASALSLIKFALIGCILCGINPFEIVGVETPNLFVWARENTAYSCFMLFFLSNAVESQLISTGAFEVTFNDQLIWSKLQSGRIPSIDELIKIIDDHVNVGGNQLDMNEFAQFR
jgi:selT/selW/selH-like putative selenoprotein